MRGRNQFIRSVVEKIFFCFGRVTVKTGFVYSSAWTLLGADQTVLRLLGADQTVLKTIGCGPDGFGDYWKRDRVYLTKVKDTRIRRVWCDKQDISKYMKIRSVLMKMVIYDTTSIKNAISICADFESVVTLGLAQIKKENNIVVATADFESVVMLVLAQVKR
ncbi:hypothetical protein PHYBLDRAFT_60532 [Phycomyces blakesleeanus NRRL 1555(-)]|uniref:Uncharacterized protein n=1 Tax=Phycomyces blakesleeanus (strain ATCC 8743b / DSM 1359 / FGSC 10004 / NBRC 33097 / NRRL 1555) TaxID=763407 RepID=A0A167P7F3_PHYB8|nr:hypothetical protein PHYBLDRAFT_60532 [Phycomyces blakesleeanus NRRL 1555(-)]OAD77399.1 hypothetical protein PHYBLDRAFT_60532 [Phycomyces blakesleeanus NRRL 1555(-)]|eukprot:XP_018295439.1 hypothetical protein PHYBLDRAFT_60532 [Phycomyces blakesleeanus NRRL 1555(-)]